MRFLKLSLMLFWLKLGLADPYFPNMKACFLLYNMKTGTFDKVIGEENCKERFLPCSTFKVPLAVMAFDSGVLKDENVVLKWDGKKNDRKELDQDQNAKTWIKYSVVWFSQRLTPQLGEKRLKKYLEDFQYGNKDISSGITQFWLGDMNTNEAGLKISAYEQMEFMKKLWTNKLPVSQRAMQLTRDITFIESSPKGFKLSGKTGSSYYQHNHKLRLGWFVAHLEDKKSEYLIVTNFNDLAPTKESSYGGLAVRDIAKKILGDQGLW